jgi:hypothetical protein
MVATERAYPTIGGVRLRYVRTDPDITRYQARSTASFEVKLDAFSRDIIKVSPGGYGRLIWLGTAGAYVNKPGYHGLGRAFDLDVVRWSRVACRPIRRHHANRARTIRRRYIGIDALARRWFKYVLDGWYNAAHRDHIHVDDGGGALVFNPRYRSDVVFIQAAVNDMISGRLVIDGIYGPLTDRAFVRLKNRLGVPHRVSSQPRVYRRFLWRLAYYALRNRTLH